jgi:hypothetical protein
MSGVIPPTMCLPSGLNLYLYHIESNYDRVSYMSRPPPSKFLPISLSWDLRFFIYLCVTYLKEMASLNNHKNRVIWLIYMIIRCLGSTVCTEMMLWSWRHPAAEVNSQFSQNCENFGTWRTRRRAIHVDLLSKKPKGRRRLGRIRPGGRE